LIPTSFDPDLFDSEADVSDKFQTLRLSNAIDYIVVDFEKKSHIFD